MSSRRPLAAVTLALVAACARAPVPGPPPTLDELKSASYRGIDGIDQPVTLAEGRWEGPPNVEGGASRPTVAFVGDFRLEGDVDGDGADEAVVLLDENSGGSGVFTYLALVARRDGRLDNRATALVGDRVQLRRGWIDEAARRVVLELVQAGPDDPACCPGEWVTRAWEPTPDGLRELPATEPSRRLAPEAIGGDEWVLRAWGRDEPAAAEPEITLSFAEGTLRGSAGCNGFFAAAVAASPAGSLVVGPAGSTMRECPEPGTMEAEARFLALLPDVTRFSFEAGRLVLTYGDGGAPGAMIFDPRR